MPARPYKRLRAAFLAGLASVLAAGPAPAADVAFGLFSGAVGVPVKSIKEARFDRVVRQIYDFSCGSAALATLLTHHYDMPMTEEQAFREMFKAGDQAAIKASGFSLFDMQAFLKTRGMKADGFRITLDQLASTGIPAITLINTRGYNHFVVVKGLSADGVLVGDPALGMKIMPRAEFDESWQGIFFVIRDETEKARQFFNNAEDWKVKTLAPFTAMVDRGGLAGLSLMLPGFNEF